MFGLLSSPVKSFSARGRAFASKMPSTNDKKLQQSAKLWDWFANGYSKQPIKDEQAYQKKLQVTQSYLQKSDSVLEIGCGTGGTSILHSPFVRKILATDISSKMLEIANQKASDAGVQNIEFQRTSADELQLPKQSQNVVLGLSILHLLDNKEEVIRKVHSWLKPGGLFVTSTICVGDMNATTRFFVNNIMPIGNFFGVIPRVHAFTKAELKDSLRSSGFDIEYEWQPDKSDAAVFLIGRKK